MDKTDAALKALERRIKIVYTKAYQELRDEAAAVLAKIEMSPDMMLAEKMSQMAKYDRLNKLSEQMADTAYNANVYARKMIDDEMVNIYGINYNADAERLGFSLADNTAIKKILTKEEDPFVKISSLYDKTGIRNQMKGQLMTGLLKGEGIPKMAKRLQHDIMRAAGISEDKWGIKKITQKYFKQSITIARTETTRVQNSAKMDIGAEGKRLGLNMYKRWVATTDGRVREDHIAMNGVEVPQDSPFIMPNGDRLMFPGDISLGASAESVINCRCTIIEFIKNT